jgi:hypothetical protein
LDPIHLSMQRRVIPGIKEPAGASTAADRRSWISGTPLGENSHPEIPLVDRPQATA